MSQRTYYIAVDLGAESGRVMLGCVAQTKLTLQEIHRFGNGPADRPGPLRWDFDKLLAEIKAGIAQAIQQAPDTPAGIAVDSWGVDYGLIGDDGKLLETPYHYRDSRTDGMLEKAYELMPKREIYENTGLQFMQLNTAFQLLAHRLQQPDLLAKAKNLILFADLIAYHLCGQVYAEYCLASTSQLMDMRTGQWSKPVFDKLGLPLEIMPKIVQPGTIVGKLTDSLAQELNCPAIPVIAVGSHDTASAVAAVPAQAGAGNWAYLSSGTWSLMGVETPKAVITDKTFQYEFTNEGGVRNTIRLLKNIMGLWLVQECRREWQRQGEDLSYAQITQLAQDAQPFRAYVDPTHSDFFAPGDMPAKINAYLKQSGQAEITDKGQLIRAVLESLAMIYRKTITALEDATDSTIDVLHIVGGGIQNELLCQFAANATNKTVIAGPVEATASGNILMQAIATGQIDSLQTAREIVGKSFQMKTYHPAYTDAWQEQYQKFVK